MFLPERAKEIAELTGASAVGEISSTFDQVRCDFQDCGGCSLTDGFEELNTDEMDVAGVLLALNPGLDRRHAGRDER